MEADKDVLRRVKLTPAEREVFNCWYEPVKVMALLLGKSSDSVKRHRSNIVKKLGIGRMSEVGSLLEDAARSQKYIYLENVKVLRLKCPKCGEEIEISIGKL